jgi:hypothetical protein
MGSTSAQRRAPRVAFSWRCQALWCGRPQVIKYSGIGAPWGYPPWQQVPYPDPSWQVVAEQRMFDRCMRGRGYELMRTDKKG